MLGLLAVVAAAAPVPASGDTLVLQGSTTFTSRLMLPHQAEIEQLAGHKLTIFPNKSSLGLLSLFEKRSDLGMISTALPGEVTLLRQDQPDLSFDRLQVWPVAKTRLAFAIHPSNPIRHLPGETMRRILLGEIVNWQEAGGADLPIRVVMVRDGGGVQLSVEQELLGNRKVEVKDPIRVQIGTQVVKVVRQEPGALGLAQLGVLKQHQLPEIMVDPPVFQTLALVTLGDPTPAMKAVIDATRRVAKKYLF